MKQCFQNFPAAPTHIRIGIVIFFETEYQYVIIFNRAHRTFAHVTKKNLLKSD